MKDDSIVGDVDRSNSRFIKGFCTYHHVFLKLDDLPGVQGGQGEVGGGIRWKLQGGLQIEWKKRVSLPSPFETSPAPLI